MQGRRAGSRWLVSGFPGAGFRLEDVVSHVYIYRETFLRFIAQRVLCTDMVECRVSILGITIMT